MPIFKTNWTKDNNMTPLFPNDNEIITLMQGQTSDRGRAQLNK